MKVSCPTCDSKYNIADEKVLGRRVKVRCKSCGGQILVDGAAKAGEHASASASDNEENDATRVFSNAERSAFDAEQEDVAASNALVQVESDPAPKSTPGELIWSVNVSETDERSMTTDELVAAKLAGQLEGEVYVWHDGMTDWLLIADVPELAKALAAKQPAKAAVTASRPMNAKPEPAAKGSVAPAAQASAEPKKALPGVGKGATAAMAATPSAATEKKTAARVSSAKRPQSAHDLFAAASSKASADVDVAVSKDDAADAKMTGARNESSVLFSLDALKAGIVSSPQASSAKTPAGRKGPPAAPKKRLEDLMATGTAAPLPGPGPLLMSTTQALLTAPAPPPPKPEPLPTYVSTAPAAVAASSPSVPAKSKKGLWIAAAVVALGAVGALAVALSGGKEKTAATAEPSASMLAKVPAPETPKPTEPAPEVAKPAEPVASAASEPAAAASAAPPSTPAAVADTKANGTTAKTPATKTADTKPADTKTAEPKKEPKKEPADAPASSGATAPFSRDAAVQALGVAASQASSCKKPGGPTGSGKVQVTFAPSGRVTTANVVGGSFGGTPVGGCVSSVFKRARVPPFAGGPVTVAKGFTISP